MKKILIITIFLIGIYFILMNFVGAVTLNNTPVPENFSIPAKALTQKKPANIPAVTTTTIKPANAGGELFAPDMKKILDRGKLIVGVYSKDRPPFFMTDDKGELYGFDISLSKDIAKNLNVSVEFNRKAQTFNELVDMVAKGEIDIVISKFSRTFDRAKILRFSRPYIHLRQAVLVNRMDAVKNHIENYPMDYLRTADVKIGVVKGTSFIEYSKAIFKNATIIEYVQWAQAVDALVKGEIMAALYDDNEVIKLVRQNPDIALYASVFVLKDKKDPIAMGVSWQSTQLLSWLDAYLETYDIEKDVTALIKEYPEVYTEGSIK